MNLVNFNDPSFMQSATYQEFISKNTSSGYLNIRAYAANAALPIKGLKVVVSKVLNNNRVIFFNGLTDESGVIEKIVLPAPILSKDDEIIPLSENYDIEATYDNQISLYKIVIYSNISVNQNINIVPNQTGDSSYGS